jgi:hypothetical protein
MQWLRTVRDGGKLIVLEAKVHNGLQFSRRSEEEILMWLQYTVPLSLKDNNKRRRC